ncbi:MAG TPA: zinc-ribbon domain-containing protein [Acetivibrio sp.]|jgi:hypothetical protein|nr:hypothetical protein [Clostridium sp.]HQA58583.1 zinc-ribbon domain-containing protein [Acetivibrio sp.]
MRLIRERVAYLKGLAEGMQINDSTNEGKIIKAMIEVLDDIALSVDDLTEVQQQLEEHVDDIDEDLAELERLIYDEDDEYDDDDTIAELECPHCHKVFELKEDMIDDNKESFKCPLCNEDISIQWECDCDECNSDEH